MGTGGLPLPVAFKGGARPSLGSYLAGGVLLARASVGLLLEACAAGPSCTASQLGKQAVGDVPQRACFVGAAVGAARLPREGEVRADEASSVASHEEGGAGAACPRSVVSGGAA